MTLAQPLRGQKVGIDPVLLAHFVPDGPFAQAADLGAGNGVVAVLLAAGGKARQVEAVEIMADMAFLARRSVNLNRLDDRVRVQEEDLRRWASREENRGRFDLVTCNPPYRALGFGNLPPDPLKASHRFEVHLKLCELAAAVASLLGRGGVAAFIYSRSRKEEFLSTFEQAGLHPQVMQDIRPRQGEPVQRFLALLGRDRAALRHLPDLVLHPSAPDEGGKYTPAVEAILGPGEAPDSE